jgi:Tfp pilus assembly protein PilN
VALSPTIPTSFVPKQPVSSGSNRPQSSGVNFILIGSLIVGGGAIAIALGVFLYSLYLGGIVKSEGSQLLAAQENLSQNRVSEFIKLRNRLTATKTLLSQHVSLSQFFTLLEGVTLTNVSFTSLDIKVAGDRSAVITLSGVAKNFNALAAESSAFAGSKVIKSAIFSGITVNSNNTVAFTINATLDPSIVVEKSPSAMASTTSATITTPITAPVPSVQTATPSPVTTKPASVPSATASITPTPVNTTTP